MKKTKHEFFARNRLAILSRLLFTALVSFAATFGVIAQTRVTGRVTDEGQRPLQGVSVVVKGTSNGTTTDAAGNFTLNAAGANSVLVISYVGYGTIEQRVGTNTTINLSLVPSAQNNLNEVVVIGYGTATKRDLTGSITKIAGREVADKPNANPVASLQGRVAGLSVVNSGTPGEQPDIRIRGTVSIGQVNPLFVVDGIFQDNINYLNPNDIESIEVLKDPSSLAIFGVRGATGVIAITTKKARAGQVVVNFNTSYGFKTLVDKIQMANAEQFKNLFAQERANNGITTPYDYTGLTADTDWIDAVTRTGKFSNNNLSISGSSERNRFNFGLGYIYDEGLIKHEQLSRITLSLNDELRVSKAFRLGITFNASRQRNPYGAGWVLDAARKVIPLHSAETKPFRVANPYNRLDTSTVNIYSALNVGLQSSGVINPLVVLENEWDKTRGFEYRTVGSIYGELTFLRDFTFRSTVYADMSNVNTRVYTPLYYAYNPVKNEPELYSQNTRVGENDENWRKFQQDHVLTYKKNIGAHGITATGGFTTYYFGFFGRYANASPFTGITGRPIPNDPRFWYINSGYQDPTKTSASSGQSEYTTVSYLARVLYNYSNKYFLNLSFRDDASSRIPELNRHQKFWAVGAAWDPLKEDFMRSVSFFNSLRLKGSIGVLGNQTASTLDGSQLNYPFYPNLRTGTAAVFGSVVHRPAEIDYIPNPDLRWESVAAQEIGVELTAFENRFRFEFNYFNKTTRDLMTYVERASIGLTNKLINGGKIRNWGQEITASWNQSLSRDVTLNVSSNITFLKNEVIELSEELPTGVLIRGFQNNGSAEARTLPGNPIGSFFGYVVEGIYQSQVDILKSPAASALGSYRPGSFKFKDVDGNGIIDANDRTVIGNPTPDFTYGASANINYKGFSLGVDVNGVYGNEIFRTWGSLESPFQRVNYAGFQADAWNGAGTSNWVPLVSQADRFNFNGSTYNIEDGSYFRIRNLQLGYSFNRNFLNRFRMTNLRVFVNVQNLKTWKNNQGYTPEFGGGATAFGFDNAGGAIPRVTTAGLNVTF
jgi:TonB-linked SusC/RagA family outer membrane protein